MRKLVKEQKRNVEDAQRLTTRSSSFPSQRWGQENVALSNPGRPEEGPVSGGGASCSWCQTSKEGCYTPVLGRLRRRHPRACHQSSGAELGLGVLSWGVRWAALDHGSRVDT